VEWLSSEEIGTTRSRDLDELLASAVLSPVQGIFSRLWQILFLPKVNTWEMNWVFWALFPTGVLLRRDRDPWLCHKMQ